MEKAITFKNLAILICIACAFTLQTQLTIFAAPPYMGIRINATDLLVPFAGFTILWSLFRGQSLWPKWDLGRFYFWIGAITLLLAAASVNTYLNFGHLSQWAVVNKLLGWVVLVGILGLGGWFATNAPTKKIELFFVCFITVFLAVLFIQFSVASFLGFLSVYQWVIDHGFYPWQIEGFMANRNAYALLFLAVLFYATCFYMTGTLAYGGLLTKLLYFMLPFFVLFDGSRAMVLALVFLLPILFLTFKQYKKSGILLLCMVLGASSLLLFDQDNIKQTAFFQHRTTEILSATAEADKLTLEALKKNVGYSGDLVRLTILQDAWEQIQKNPVLGSGLGSAMMYQSQKHGIVLNVIDSTPTWVITEMGLVGFFLFAAFYILVLKTIWQKSKSAQGMDKAILQATIFTILGFSIMCVFHEIMYTRHMWFLIGLALALPISKTRLPE